MDLSLYQIIRIQKKKGVRIIHAPCDELKARQREYLRNEIRGKPKWPSGLTAFLPKRSIKDAAQPHIGKRYLVHLDIKDFFHHVTKRHIVKAYIFDRFLIREIETRATPLSNMDWRRTPPPLGLLDLAFIPSPKISGEECLPQGSPLSPHLSLLASKVIYFKIRKMLWKRNLDAAFTMYADGIFLSSDDKRVIPIGLHGVERILISEGYRANRDKFRVMRNSSSQRVCGVVVNKKLSIPRKKRHELRGRIHNLWKDALQGKDIDPGEFLSVEGYFSHAFSIDPVFAAKYKPQIDFVRMYLKGRGLLPLGTKEKET